MIYCLLRFFLRGRRTRGGELAAYRPHPGEQLALLSSGRRVDDPDEAEALGLTADARRMRRESGRP